VLGCIGWFSIESDFAAQILFSYNLILAYSLRRRRNPAPSPARGESWVRWEAGWSKIRCLPKGPASELMHAPTEAARSIIILIPAPRAGTSFCIHSAEGDTRAMQSGTVWIPTFARMTSTLHPAHWIPSSMPDLRSSLSTFQPSTFQPSTFTPASLTSPLQLAAWQKGCPALELELINFLNSEGDTQG
jgi:hypothetical protein